MLQREVQFIAGATHIFGIFICTYSYVGLPLPTILACPKSAPM